MNAGRRGKTKSDLGRGARNRIDARALDAAARGHQLGHGVSQPNIETGWETLRRIGIRIIQLMRGHASIPQTQPLPDCHRRGAATRIGDELK